MKSKLIILLILGLACSCNDFLTENPKHAWTGDMAMTNREKAIYSINGIYSYFAPGDDLNANLNTSLATKAGFINTSTVDYNMAYTQASSGGSSMWATLFRTINTANFAIQGIPGISDAAFPDPAEKSRLIAEAKLLEGLVPNQ